MNCSGESTGSNSNITQSKKLTMLKRIYSKAKRPLGSVIKSNSMSLDRNISKSSPISYNAYYFQRIQDKDDVGRECWPIERFCQVNFLPDTLGNLVALIANCSVTQHHSIKHCIYIWFSVEE